MEWYNINDVYNKEIIDKETAMILSFCDDALVDPKNEGDVVTAVDSTSVLLPLEQILEIRPPNKTNDKSNSASLSHYNPLEIIQMQIIVISHVLKHFKMFKLDNIDVINQGLSWIFKSSSYLANSIKQAINTNKTNQLMRSSYKFCNKKCDCVNQYGFLFSKRSKSCIHDHYVHHKIVSDIDNLLNYIKRNRNNREQLINLEIEVRKSLETLNYVINHMNQELSSFVLYFGDLNSNAKKPKYNIRDFYRHVPCNKN